MLLVRHCTNVWNNDQGWSYIRDCRVCLLCHDWSKAESLDLIRNRGRLKAQWQTEGLYLAVQVCTCMDMDCCPGNLTTKPRSFPLREEDCSFLFGFTWPSLFHSFKWKTSGLTGRPEVNQQNVLNAALVAWCFTAGDASWWLRISISKRQTLFRVFTLTFVAKWQAALVNYNNVKNNNCCWVFIVGLR